MITQSYLTDLTYKINGACIEVHRIMGPGLLESVYHQCLIEEFSIRNIIFKSELRIPVIYKGKEINCGFSCDFLVEDQIVLEIKSVSSLNEIHRAQVLNYINLLQKPKGILVNFNVKNLYHLGQETFVNKYYDMLF
ncbi:GxxExxY protein [Chryseobacterium sp. Leaf404]|uniref:GxxExxY protein n=1 Tax=unclassified Chryseobacterium TaxID=2593645 RepID=UPI0006F724D1|nr:MULTISPECIES: GxxExxY protein [unclassified Chryseobacterium]KQT21447.1 GxxExxY protein [Chryseobacterium sp. Leaf404]